MIELDVKHLQFNIDTISYNNKLKIFTVGSNKYDMYGFMDLYHRFLSKNGIDKEYSTIRDFEFFIESLCLSTQQ